MAKQKTSENLGKPVKTEKRKPETVPEGDPRKGENRKRIAIVRVRGSVHMKPQVKKTFEVLKLGEPNHCIVIDNRPEYRGMLLNIKDYVTWGEITPETMEKLLSSRGKIEGAKLSDKFMKEKTKIGSINNFVKDFMAFKAELNDIPGLKKTFRLNPPKKGFERLGIKKPYSIGGALGYRSGKINELLGRMM
ncbi:MAG: 50S ribosomal protein L30 [Candidatus Altiarchaeales archaeon]|nr:50S ribosomal protein L30 [Candidatus Altiarchaeales archaeon]